MKRTLFVCALLLLAACGSAPSVADIGGAANLDEVARTAGMPPLSTTTMPEGKREIRLWLSQGILPPDQLLRLTYAHDRWLGELWRYWPSGEAEHEPYSWTRESFDQTMERCGCARSIRGSEEAVCRVIEEKAIDWESVAMRLKQLDVAGLPEQPPEMARFRRPSDSAILEVEVRAGAAYHHVHYDRFDDSEPARRAGQVVQMLKDLDRSAACDRN